ncbi:MAG: glucosaminidase domain-containing protein [Thermodesulfobacteriota bacterium]|nr:glucosaminidase domain-containing protein [Thermodesulfobacteriota bacterium]
MGLFYRISFLLISRTIVVSIVFLVSYNGALSLLCAEEVCVVPDFGAIKDVVERKKDFFDFLRPIIEAENERVLKQRKRMLLLLEKHRKGVVPLSEEVIWLNRLLSEYKVERYQGDSDGIWETLLKRVDIVPVSLALNQSAKETGWGTSRFARMGNNMFGQQCFTKSCGMIPSYRIPGATYEVARFKSVNDSVRSYIHNINTCWAYSHLRQLRFDQRQAGEIPDGHTVAGGLLKYSERGNEYVKEVRLMIRINKPYMDLS